MAYATGTGANQQDFLDAVRSFALGLGWTVVKWDTVNKLLYLEKGVCHIALEWFNANLNTYTGYGGTLVVVSEGRIRGSLSQSLNAGSNDYSTFPGSVVASGQRTAASAPNLLLRQMQGPFVQWFLFSNATGDYIHCVIQTASDQYTHFGFGNADKGGLTHSGAAYAFADGGRYWYRYSASYLPTDSQIQYNDPAYTASYFGYLAGGITASCFQCYSEDALPAGFLNQQAVTVAAVSFSASYIRTVASLMPICSNDISSPSEYTSGQQSGMKLADAMAVMNAPAYSNFIPMIGIPLIMTNPLRTQACAVGSIPDLRLIDMEGMSPQQEITLGADTWKVFPELRQTNWSEIKLYEAPTSGQFALAYKKIV